jgi:hypothetical protein
MIEDLVEEVTEGEGLVVRDGVGRAHLSVRQSAA